MRGVYWKAGQGATEHHPRALPTLSQSNGIGFRLNIPVSELIRHITQTVEASVVNSAPLAMETEDGVARENTANP